MSDLHSQFLERLAERQRARDAKAGSESIAELCAKIRAWYYPKQAGFLRSKARLRATTKNRRAGATAGGVREWLARSIEQPGFRATYTTTTRIEARDRAWESDTKSGFLDVLRQLGEPIDDTVEAFKLGGVTVKVWEGDLALDFSNGSQIELFGADNARAINKKRGGAKHVFWIDEAQDFTHLQDFYKGTVVAALTDYQGECWLTGTPGKICAGMFWDVTRNDEEPRLEGWEVHDLSILDNPFFGTTTEERWARGVEEARTLNSWSIDDPDFQREYLGKWVKSDALYVYAVHSVPQHEIVFAPQRLDALGFPDLGRAVDDLPRLKRGQEYFLAMGADLGTRDDFALVVWAWSLQDPILYEVCSWKRPGLDYDEMAAHLHAVMRQRHCGLVTADAGGGGKPAVMGWSKKWVERYGLPIAEATKTNKELAIKQLNGDIRHGRIRLRSDGPLLIEWRVHRWLPTRSATGLMVEDPKTPNHCADAALYAHRESYHHRFRPPVDEPKVGTSAYALREESQLEEDAGDEQ